MSWIGRHRWWFVALGSVFALVLAAAASAYGYDRAQSDMIAKGVRIGSVNVGGMSSAEARAHLNKLFHPLRQSLVLRYPGGRVVLPPAETNVRVNTDELVDEALRASRHGWFGPRAWRELTGGKVEARLEPKYSYSHAAVNDALDEIEQNVDLEPRNAKVNATFDKLVVFRGKPGRGIYLNRLERMIRHALVSRHAKRHIDVPVRVIEPKVSYADLKKKTPSYITIDRGGFKLRVYQHLKLARTYSIAVGQAGLETPAGVYHIQDKQVDPAWHVPLSAWAGSLAGQTIPPGPSDPLKARWMGLWNGAGIHGTEETWSIGHAASHGCVRMLIPDVIDLYDRVEVGTPVYIGD